MKFLKKKGMFPGMFKHVNLMSLASLLFSYLTFFNIGYISTLGYH